MNWIGVKALVAEWTVEEDALHIYLAFLVQIGAAALLRRSLGSWLPWAAVFVLELVNEFLDIWLGGEPDLHAWQISGGVHDLINTMLLPTALLILCRRSPRLFDRSNALTREARADEPGPSEADADAIPAGLEVPDATVSRRA